MTGLIVAVSVLWVLVLVLAVAVFAVARQVGVLFERVAPMGALVTDSGPRVGEASPRFDLAALDGRAVAVGAEGARALLRGEYPDVEAVLRYYATGIIDHVDDPPRDGSHRPQLMHAMAERVAAILAVDGVLRVPKTAGCFVADL